MASVPKPSLEANKRGSASASPGHDEQSAAGTLTPPPLGCASSVAGQGPDSPTLIALPYDAPTILDFPDRHETSIDSSDAATQIDVVRRQTAASLHISGGQPVLQVGTLLANRYEILAALGEGGMGAVYKARDRELNRPVALKVIRPDLARNQSIVDRFKQELLLAREVTHKNVIRIYDLGESEGLRFITMEFIEGEDLRSLLLRKEKLSRDEAVDIIQQVCRALEAAHNVGVIHRDLKPQNIMRDKSGRILVMDFGLARTLEGDGMTQTGALIGTIDYMSPEQALGKPLDQRSDLFAIGLIFYELLTRKMPYVADSGIASLLKRTQERAAPVIVHDATIPPALSGIVGKCLDPAVNLRYQSAGEILADLQAWQGGRAAATLRFPASQRPWAQTIPWHWVGAVTAALALAVVGFLLADKVHSSQGTVVPQASLAILPFRNASGDSSIDWIGTTAAEMLRADMGQSVSLRTIPSDRVVQILHDMRVEPDARLDPDTLHRVAEFTSADRLLWGQFTKLGNQIRIDVTLQDMKTHRNSSLTGESPSEKELPTTLQHLAETVEKTLELPVETIKEIQAKALRPSSQSVQALRYYSEGMQLSRQGKTLDAVKHFESATKEDSGFALAYSKLATSYATLGYGDKAQELSRKAVELSDRSSPQERYLIQAENARITKNYDKAIESYDKLTGILPEDSDVQYALARLHEDSGAFEKAQAEYQKILAHDPKNQDALLHMGWVQIRRNNSPGSLEYLNRGLALAVQLQNQDEKAAILDAIGTAYHFLNQQDDALANYHQALEIKRKLENKAGMAETLNLIGQTQEAAGKPNDALKTYQEALLIRREVGDKAGLGRSLLDMGGFNESLGHYDDALRFTKEALPLLRELGDRQNEAMCLNNIGWIYLDKADYENAMMYLQQGLGLRQEVGSPVDVADSFYNIGETYGRMGEYSQSMGYYLKALDIWRKADDKRGVAFASYGLGRIFQYQARYRAALTSERDALKSWQDTNEHGFWLPEIQASYGNALSLVGHSEEAQKVLEEALGDARVLNNDSLQARILNFQGDRLFYNGDNRSAKSLFQQASQVAARSKDREQSLLSKFNLLKIDVPTRHTPNVVNSLRSLADETDRSGLKHLSIECSTYLAAALIDARDYSQARQVLNRNLDNSEKLGLQTLLATNHYLQGEALRLSGNRAEAVHHYAEAYRILEDVRNEAHTDDVMKRSDLATIYKESAARRQASTN